MKVKKKKKEKKKEEEEDNCDDNDDDDDDHDTFSAPSLFLWGVGGIYLYIPTYVYIYLILPLFVLLVRRNERSPETFRWGGVVVRIFNI